MSREETKPQDHDNEPEEDKSQDEAEKSAEAEVKNEEDGVEDKPAAPEGTDGETEEDDDAKKPAKKRPVKAEEEDEEKGSDEEDEEEEEGDREGVDEDEKKNGTALKRERKKPDRLAEEKKDKKEVEVEIPAGKGTPFGKCPRIEHFIKIRDLDQLKKLHSICFGRVGKPDVIKENLLKFKGFDYEPESDAYTKKKQSIAKMDLKHIKEVCDTVDLDKKGKKDDIVNRLMDFFMDPKDSGLPVPAVPAPRPKRTSAVKANNRGFAGLDDGDSDDDEGGRRGRAAGRRAKARPSYKDDSSSEEDKRAKKAARGYSDSDAEAEISPSESDSDSPKKKKVAPAKPKGKGGSKKKTPAPKATKRAAPKRGKKKASESEEEEEEESEDEPLQKKTKKFPSDDEIKKYVKQILDGANLEEITMKTVCKQVYGRYPEHDLTHKKDLIKTTVKSLIAT